MRQATVEGDKQVEALSLTYLADDDARGPHPQRLLDQAAQGNLTRAFEAGLAALHRGHVTQWDLQLEPMFATLVDMTTRTAIYVRISSDPAGKRLGVTRQLADCRKKAKTMGWTVAAVYEDNDVSASTGKVRPAYQRMLTDLEAGRLDAVIVWDLDRLTRRPIEVEQFIDLADRKGISLGSVGGDVDLATDNGRMFARIKGAVARAEVERKSERQRSANAQRADSGIPHAGRRAFGYSPNGMEVVEPEAAEVRKAVEALLAGGSLRGIVADMNARGVCSTAGGPWRPTEMRRLLANPRYCALLSRRGEVVGPGSWPAIIDEDTHKAVRAVLSDPARHKAGHPRQHLLSGVATCVCGARIFGSMVTRGPVYMCETRGHVARRSEDVDRVIVALVIGRLSQPDAAQILARPGDKQAATDLRVEERGLRARLNGLSEAFAGGDIDREQLRAGSQRLRARLDVVVEQLAGMARIPVLTGLLTAENVEEAWHALDVDSQRSVIDALLTVVILSPGQGARVFDPRTVQTDWRMTDVR